MAKMDGSSIDRLASSILTFWFEENDLKTNYRTKWFPPASSEAQRSVDEAIKQQFGDLLTQAEDDTFDLEAWQSSPQSCLACILLLDQFSRHVYRDVPDRDTYVHRNDQKAISCLEVFLAHEWHHALTVDRFVFVLMPLRHSPTPERLYQVLELVESRESMHVDQQDLLNRFRKVTQSRLLHLKPSEVEQTSISDQDILEREFVETDEADMPKHPLYKAMNAFLLRHEARRYPYLSVSLSGGVDSMVIAHLLHKLRPLHNNFTIIAVHIDYGNRRESADECDYVRRWCERFGIQFYARRIDEVKRGVTKRDEYEKIARDIRYSTYADVMQTYGVPGMIFGHHKGDVQENVISNAMKGMSLLDLNGMDETSSVNNVSIWRPLLAFDKDVIYAFAHMYGVPYFKDTTPQWSTRGKLRNQLVPLLQDMYGDGVLQNLSKLGDESSQCGQLLQDQILSPILSNVIETKVAIIVSCTKLMHQPILVWKEVIKSICHDRLGTGMIREKPMRELMGKVDQSKPFVGGGTWVTLKKTHRSYLTQDRQLMIFREHVFPRFHSHFTTGTQVELGKTVYGPWTVDIQIVESSQVQEVNKHWCIDDVVAYGGVEYVLSNAPKLVLDGDDRPTSLKQIPKVLTDVMPLVNTRGTLEKETDGENEQWLRVRVVYDEGEESD